MVSLRKIKSIWDMYGFEIILVSCILFIAILSMYRKIRGYKGTWSSHYTYLPPTKKPSQRSDSKGEIECRRILETFFGKPFAKSRPDFLRNPVTGGNYNLELDCYNEELGLAVEYNGQQHYKYIPYFHKNKEAFLNQKYRDLLKRKLCEEHNVILIEIPYTVEPKSIQSYLLNKLNNLKIQQ